MSDINTPTSDDLASTSSSILAIISGTSVEDAETKVPLFIPSLNVFTGTATAGLFCSPKTLTLPSDGTKSVITDQTSFLNLVDRFERKKPFILPDTST